MDYLTKEFYSNDNYQVLEKEVKFIKKRRYDSYARRLVGDCPLSVDSISERIEECEGLTEAQRVELEKMISVNAGNQYAYDSTTQLGRSTLNMLLMFKNKANGFISSHRLSDISGLRLHALVYSNWVDVEVEETCNPIPGVTIVSTTKTVTKNIRVIRLTSYGKIKLRELAQKGERIVKKDMHNLRQLGFID